MECGVGDVAGMVGGLGSLPALSPLIFKFEFSGFDRFCHKVMSIM